MTSRYYTLSWDVNFPGRWYLDHPVNPQGQEIWTWLFQKGEPVSLEGPIRIPIYKAGRPTDYSELSGASIPVVNAKIASLFAALAPQDVQFLPVDVDSQPEPYCLVNVVRIVKCIDDEASGEVRYWKPEDGRPEKVGQYRAVYGLRIDPTKVGDARILRPWGWTVALIVSSDIKEAMERAGVTGAKFEEAYA